jgi:RimJ/RimL family protein N-acetyltransferase
LAPALRTVTFFETARLLFRSHEAADEPDFVAMQTDPEVRRYVGGKPWSYERAVYRFRHEYLGKPSKTFGLWATVLKAESRYIGYCGLHRQSNENGDSVRLGYYIARPYWRQGLATEAAQAFIDLAFSQLRLTELFADVEKGHYASEHILRKFGFVLVGQEELPARILHIYGLQKNDWTPNPRS